MKKFSFIIILVALLLVSGCSKSYLKEISYDEYKKLLEDEETFILEVMSDDCTACKDFRPKLKDVASSYKIEVKYINIDKLTADQYDELAVSATPTVIFYIDGEEETTAARIVGSVKREKIIPIRQIVATPAGIAPSRRPPHSVPSEGFPASRDSLQGVLL